MANPYAYMEIRLGDLALLTELRDQHAAGVSAPLSPLLAAKAVSKDAARGARNRLEEGFGPLFKEGPRGKSMVPNTAGHNVANAYVLFEALVSIAISDLAEQDSLSDLMQNFATEIARASKDGKTLFKRDDAQAAC